MQISLAADGVAFRPGDRKLLFKTGLGKPQELPIEHIIPAPKAPEMPPSKLVKVEIKKLTILDCADDDEDVKMSISVSGLNGSAEIPYKNDSRPDEYVYPFSREGGFRSIFFVALQTDVFEAEKVKITVHIETLDGDGAHWGGDHVHIQEVAKLPLGTNEFREDRNKSLSPFPASPHPYEKFGNYELLYSISRIENAKYSWVIRPLRSILGALIRIACFIVRPEAFLVPLCEPLLSIGSARTDFHCRPNFRRPID